MKAERVTQRKSTRYAGRRRGGESTKPTQMGPTGAAQAPGAGVAAGTQNPALVPGNFSTPRALSVPERPPGCVWVFSLKVGKHMVPKRKSTTSSDIQPTPPPSTPNQRETALHGVAVRWCGAFQLGSVISEGGPDIPQRSEDPQHTCE